MAKTYLGDGVYVAEDGEGIRLTTEDGISVTNTIFIEPEVYEALLKFMATPKHECNCKSGGCL